MKKGKLLLSALAALVVACSSFVSNRTAQAQTPVASSPISYQKDSSIFHRQKFRSELYPFLTETETPFQYEYRILQDVSVSEPQLVLGYRDGDGEGLIGMGWQLTLELKSLRETIALDVLAPIAIPYQVSGAWHLLVDHKQIAVSRIEEDSRTLYVAPSTDTGSVHRFLHVDTTAGPLAVPYELSSNARQKIRFEYEVLGEKPLLRRISFKAGSLSLQYETPGEDTQGNVTATGQRLKRMVLTDGPTPDAKRLAQWEMAYQSEPALGLPFLVGVKSDTSGRAGRNLRFTYGGNDGGARPGASNASSVQQTSSMWKLVEGEPRWRLPIPKATLATRPGLRFMDLNHDGFLDVVESEDRRLKSWLWDPKLKAWQDFTSTYKPYRASVMSGSSNVTGAHYSGLVKVFKVGKEKFNTFRFQSFIISYYEPTTEKPGLKYTYYVCFPRVFNGVLKPDPKEGAWDCDHNALLRLPVPLQYQGEPWPTKEKGIKSVERVRNQGAQFVEFTRDGHLNLFYAGLRYRDADSGKVLLADSSIHRDTGNCREWYETTWQNENLDRRVKVDVCQGFWRTREKVWSEQYPHNYPGKPFWVRRDLGPDGKPTGQFILPAQKDPLYYAHYEGFRNVSFARLDRSRDFPVFAVVQSPHFPGEKPEEKLLEARDIYVLKDGLWLWERVDPKSGYYPPDEFFENFKGIFADVNGDGLDDAILATGPKRKTWINTGRKPRWRDAPEFYLPAGCDLGNGDCRLLALDNDAAQDLMVGDGTKVYINQALKNSGVRPSSMTSFTDEKNQQRFVSDIR